MVMQAMDMERFGADDSMVGMMPMTRELVMNNVVSPRRPRTGGFFRTMGAPHRQRASRDHVGEILVSLCYLPDANMMTISVLKARDIPNQPSKPDKLGIPDPYVEIALMHKGFRLDKRRTAVKPQSQTPVFNENFLFTVPSPKKKLLDEVNMVLTVMDYDLLGSNDEIGHAVIGHLGNESGNRHWLDALSHPERLITQWQPLTQKW